MTAQVAKDILNMTGHLIWHRENDLARHRQVYLRAYFQPFRRVALLEMLPELQLIVLDLAGKDLPKIPDPEARRQWQFQVNKDRDWLEL